LPEYKQIGNELKVFETQLQNQLKIKSQEMETKYKVYTALPANTPAIKKDKESELPYLQKNIQKFQQDAQISIQKKLKRFGESGIY
jgi:outer membrane protein